MSSDDENHHVDGAGRTPPSYICGIGASAGGLEALERFLRDLPSTTGIAFVVVQHLSPDFESMMDELLGRRTQMPVRRVEDDMPVEPDSIYVIPPRKEMIISDGRLLLTEKDPTRDLSMPIDTFFRSLARDAGARSIGVVLSGTGSDGSRGVRDIHEEGGLIMVQSVGSAAFDGMPKNAINTGLADVVLAPEQMAEVLVKYVTRLGVLPAREQEPPVGSGVMDEVLGLLHGEFGIDFSAYKPNTVGRRIERRVVLQDAASLQEYLDRLRKDQDELNQLYRDLLIGVTKFFRDPQAFEQLENDILPGLIERVSEGGELRIWDAGCATGEEAYSIAMAVHEQVSRLGRDIKIKIFATDVHRVSLEIASAAIYPEASVAEVPEARRQRYFVREGEGYRIANELRQLVVFAPHNIIRDAPFTRLDLVVCRNVLIYLRPPAQRKVLSLFHFGLRRDGVLWLGPSENLGDLGDEFARISERWKQFRKRRDGALPATDRLRMAGRQPHHAEERPQSSSPVGLMRTYDALLGKFMPPGLLVNHRRELVHTFGDAGALLQVRPGRPSLDVLELLIPELKLPVTGALQRARKHGKPVVFTGVRVPGSEQRHRLTVEPVTEKDCDHMLIRLEELDQRVPEPAAGIDIGQVSTEQMAELENELRHTRENLQATIEELETSNEELQATNEELVASNEELQSTNEELQSVNEELYTVNAELQKKIQQLTELTNDMDNLLSSTEIGTIFVDRDLTIRKFTPRIAKQFDFLTQDIGRSIQSFTHTLDIPNLAAEIRRVIDEDCGIERDVEDTQGNWHLLRILPYRSSSAIEGAVITLVDISVQKHAEAAARLAVTRRDDFLAMLSHELRNPLGAIVNAATLLRLRKGAEIDARATQIIGRQADHMARLLDDLLDVSRVTRDKLELECHVFDLREAVADAVEAVRPGAEAHDITLHIDAGDRILAVDGDRVRLQQVMANLLSNAVKYNRDGGNAWLSLAREGAEVILRVRDDGMGMEPPMLDEVFEPFVQSERGLSRSEGGMGLGLTLVKALVELHGGSVSAASDGIDRGSEFVVRLPATVGAARAPRPPTGEPAPGARHHILIVEDSDDHRETLRELLELSGYDVVTAEDGTRGIAAIKSKRPDVALVDIGLPGIDGYELARQVREQVGDGMRLVALTGYGSERDRKAALEAGFDEHLVKPVDGETLARLLARLGRG